MEIVVHLLHMEMSIIINEPKYGNRVETFVRERFRLKVRTHRLFHRSLLVEPSAYLPSEYHTRISKPGQVHSRHRDQHWHSQEHRCAIPAPPRTGRHAPPASQSSFQARSVKDQVKKWTRSDHCYNCEAMLPRLLAMATREVEVGSKGLSILCVPRWEGTSRRAL